MRRKTTGIGVKKKTPSLVACFIQSSLFRVLVGIILEGQSHLVSETVSPPQEGPQIARPVMSDMNCEWRLYCPCSSLVNLMDRKSIRRRIYIFSDPSYTGKGNVKFIIETGE